MRIYNEKLDMGFTRVGQQRGDGWRIFVHEKEINCERCTRSCMSTHRRILENEVFLITGFYIAYNQNYLCHPIEVIDTSLKTHYLAIDKNMKPILESSVDEILEHYNFEKI